MEEGEFIEEGILPVRGTMNERGELERVFRGALWGLGAAGVMAVFMLLGALGGGQDRRPFPVLILSQVMGHRHGAGVWLVATLCHFGFGALAGIGFAFMTRPMTLGKGLGYSLFLWGLMGVTFLPWLGWGDLGLLHNPRLTFYFMFLHLVYGAVLGQLGARDEQGHDARFDDLGRLYTPPSVDDRHTVRVR